MRGYQFNKAKIGEEKSIEIEKILVTTGQLRFELNWLRIKMQRRDPTKYQ
jgi:hypothetical protein